MNPTQTGIAVGLALAVIGSFFIFPWFSPFGSMPSGDPAGIPAGTIAGAATTTSPTTTMPIEDNGQLQITDLTVGTGVAAAAGDTVTVNYVGTFVDGTVFDSSASHPETASGFPFTLGQGSVIAGWDQGVAGMQEGGKRRLVVPPALGYGPNDYGPIPGNSTLVFEVELLKVQKGSGSVR